MPRLRFSTSVLAGEKIVPWLASAGELSYSPHSPPDRDYYFQPHIDRGEAVLYRGLQKAEKFLRRRLATADLRTRWMSVHARTIANSATSFNAVHCNVSRTETGWFNGRSFILGDLCREAGLEPKPPIQSLLYSGFTLEEWCATGKFGPNYVKFRTPLSNFASRLSCVARPRSR